MSSAPSVPDVEVGASWLGDCEHVLTAGALELLVVLHGTFGQRRAELSESRAVRDTEPAAIEMMDALALQAAEPPSGAAGRLAGRAAARRSGTAPGRPL